MVKNSNNNNKEFYKKLQNPTKPINNTKVSEEMLDYLNNINNHNINNYQNTKKNNVNTIKRVPICPGCRRKSLKLTPQKVYCCGFCGLMSNSPSYIYEKDNE